MFKLIKIYFINSLKLNNFRLGDKKGKMWGFAALMAFVAVSCLFTAGQYAYGVAAAGLSKLMMPLFMSAASIVTIFSALFSAKNILFGFKDYDMQASLPIKHSKIVASRFFILYVYEFLITAVLLIPSAAVYNWFVGADTYFYISFILTLFFIPLIPLVIGAILGAMTGVLSSRFRKNGIIQMVLLLIVTLGLVGLSWSSNRGVTANAVNAVYDSISRRWPPAMLYGKALDGDILSLSAFIALSCVVFLLFVFVTGRWFNKINSAITAVFTKGNYKIKGLKSRGVIKTLVYREFRAYFGSTIWVFNTAFGIIILLGLAVASMFAGQNVLSKLGSSKDMLLPAIPLYISFMVCMSNISCSSVSMENGRLWLIRSLPISDRAIMFGKMAVNIIMTAPACIIAAILFCISLRPGLTTGIYMFLTPLAYSLFVAPFGLAVNLLMPKLEWTSDTQVVKQSGAVVVAVFAGMAAVGIPIVLSFTLNAGIVMLCTTIAAALAGSGLIMWINRAGVKKFRTLS